MTQSRSRILAGFAVALVLAVILWHLHRPVPHNVLARTTYPALSHRVTVEVLNAGAIPGAARVATMRLRQGGLDVVYYGTTDSARGAGRTRIIVRRGDTTGVARARAMLGRGDMVTAPDATRLVDLSVILGGDFVPDSVAADSA